MATEKNTLKNWFRNGLKPTQEQFWAWIDSFYHKSDKIPQQQIEGLAESLSNKADASQLSGKADLVGGKVPESQLPPLKDTTKLDKPEADGSWIVNKTGDAISWVSANSFGKNMANSQLVTTAEGGVTQGYNYTWDTAGYYLYFKGLPDKSNDTTFNKMVVRDTNGQIAEGDGKVVLESLIPVLPSVKDERTGVYDANFSEYIIFNPITRKMARSDRPQIITNFNVPSTININYPTTIANSNYTPTPTTPQDIADTFEMIKHLEDGFSFQPTTDDMWIEKIIPSEKLEPYTSWRPPQNVITRTGRAGVLFLEKEIIPPDDLARNTNFINSISDRNSFYNIFLNKEFPSDKDWIMRLRHHHNKARQVLLGNPGGYVGFVGSLGDSENSYNPIKADVLFGWDWEYLKGNLGSNLKIGSKEYLTSVYLYFIKKGSKLSLFIYNYGTGYMGLSTIDYRDDMKFLRLGSHLSNVYLGHLKETQLIDCGFWIQP
ncbi:hypothetical protein PG326_00750 [Riemerella anatipestifer]|nr:hypothetical protein [Riemerella anatipestifer]MDY3356864.1 hypothetical protein [Riemerella anatipestifer]